MQTRAYRVALIVWNAIAAALVVTSANYDKPDALLLATVTIIGNIVITAWRQITDGTTPTLPQDGP